jgi:hypothetical protein
MFCDIASSFTSFVVLIIQKELQADQKHETEQLLTEQSMPGVLAV